MPITASLGALTYSKSNISDTSWFLQFESELELKSMSNIGNMLYLLADVEAPNNYFFNSPSTYSSVINLRGNQNPRIVWETQILPPTYLNSIKTITQTVASSDTMVVTPTYGGLSIGTQVVFSGAVFGGPVANKIYFIVAIQAPNQIAVSQSLGGVRIALANATGSMTMTAYLGPAQPYTVGESIKYNSTNSKFYTSGSYFGYMSGYRNSDGQSGFIQTIDNTGANLTTTRNLSPNPTWVAGPFRNFLDIVPLNTTDTFVLGATAVPASIVTNPNRAIRGIYSRINSSTLSYEKYYQGPSATGDDFSQSGFTGLDSSGNAIVVWQFGGRAINYDGAYETTVIQKINPTTGTTLYTTRLYPGADVVTPVTDWPQYLMGATINSSDNIIVINKEDRLVPPTNSRGGFITCIGNAGPLFWQIHTSFQPISVTTDASDNVYVLGEVYGTNNMVVAKFDDLGTLIWCNQLSNTTYDLRAANIKLYEDYIYITGNLMKISGFSLLPYGFVMRLPIDGTIPGTGSYVINSIVAPFTLTYASTSPTITAGNTLISYAMLTMTTSSSTIDSPTFTTTNNINSTTTTILK